MLVWYIRKLLSKYWFDVDVREKFTEMLGEYEETLQSMYKLEELYGEEIIKKAIIGTQFVIEACKEFKENTRIQKENSVQSIYEEESDDENEDSKDNKEEDNVIVLREGEKVSQTASTYKKVVLQD